MTATARPNRRRGDVPVPLARCEPLPPVWRWDKDTDTYGRHERFKSRGQFHVRNDEAVDAALREVWGRVRPEDLYAIPMPPVAPRLQVVLPERSLDADFCTYGSWKFASRRLRDVLALPPDVVEFIPVEVLDGGEQNRAQDYHLMRVLAAQPAMDLNLSHCDVEDKISGYTGRPYAYPWNIDQVVLHADLQPRTELFRIEEDPTVVLATDALALRVLEAGLTGMAFSDPGVRTLGPRCERLRTTDGVRLHAAGFDGWPPRPGVHVPILGWSRGDPLP